MRTICVFNHMPCVIFCGVHFYVISFVDEEEMGMHFSLSLCSAVHTAKDVRIGSVYLSFNKL